MSENEKKEEEAITKKKARMKNKELEIFAELSTE